MTFCKHCGIDHETGQVDPRVQAIFDMTEEYIGKLGHVPEAVAAKLIAAMLTRFSNGTHTGMARIQSLTNKALAMLLTNGDMQTIKVDGGLPDIVKAIQQAIDTMNDGSGDAASDKPAEKPKKKGKAN